MVYVMYLSMQSMDADNSVCCMIDSSMDMCVCEANN
jgi:hypothetical protein